MPKSKHTELSNGSETETNWSLKIDPQNIAWLYFDRAHSDVNTISHAVLDELAVKLADIAQQSDLKGLIIASGKQDSFIAGADIEQFSKFKTSDEAMALISKGQAIFNQLAALTIPTVAMIKGFCLGGGCELVLACRYRVAEDGVKTKIGLPEVLLGLHPGWGGSVRLPALIGAPQAMDLILSGRTVNAKAAAQIGLVDIAVPQRHLEQAARAYILNPPKPHMPTSLQALTNNSLVRPLLAIYLQKKVEQKISSEHYPAPFAVIDNWLEEGIDDEANALHVEAESLAKMALTDTARNLIRVYFLQNRLKSLGKPNNKKDVGVSAKDAQLHVHVIGAGTMGGDIAAWCALRGMRVTLQDREPKFIAPAIKRAAQLFKKKLKSPRLIQQAMDLLMPDLNGLGIAHADVIIEAIFENLAAKQELFKKIEAQCKPEAILATNTSSIPLDEINTVMQNPERLVGIHFFNPVAMMQLVEVVHGKVSSTESVNKAAEFVRKIDRLPLPVKSSPGFLVNRVLMPYLMEAMVMLEENIPAAVIDEAALNFGMPMGPVELGDAVGLDICFAVANNLMGHFGGEVPKQLAQKIEKGEFGRKTGKGFYDYKKGKLVKEKVNPNEDLTVITDRLILRMLNESVACLREKVVTDGDLLDAGMIFGTGFAPFRGGPMHYAESIGIQKIHDQLQQFAKQYGPRFKPDAGWEQLSN